MTENVLSALEQPIAVAAKARSSPILAARNLTKRYGRVVALDACDFELYPGEVLAVIGDNGAGKSTLIKALSGAVVPDAGTITLEGREVRFPSPMAAREAGIETVYQTLALSPALSIADNMFLGREIRRGRAAGSPAHARQARDEGEGACEAFPNSA